MFDYDKWQEIFNSIQRHKTRTILTALGVFWGIFMLVILLGAGKGLENGVRYEFRDTAINSLWIRRGTTSMPFEGLPEGRRIKFDNEDFEVLQQTFPQIEHLTGRFYLPGDQLTTYKDETLSYPVRSVHPGHIFIERSEITSGRFINKQDVDDFRKVAVIGGTVVKDLFGEEDPIGKDIQVGKAVYKVVGTFFDSGGEYEMRVIYIPITTAQQIYGGTEDIHQLMLTTGNLSLPKMKQLEDDIRVAFAQRKQFDPKDTRALWISNVAQEYQNFENLFSAIKFFVWMVGIGSIIAGVIGVSNIMLIIVKDRTKEIGIRKAMGATPRSIISMILQEALVITSIAGYLGVVFGVLVISALGSMDTDYFKHPQVNLGVVFGAVFVLVLAGTLAGLMPALQASRIHPVEAMRQ
jgi:putative ABC transport system permease protein